MAEKRFNLRIPEELHERLEELARRDLRSLHSEILVLLADAVIAREKTQDNHPSQLLTGATREKGEE
jgi:hypothetical protein